MKSREVRLKSRPVGIPTPTNFEIATVDVPEPQPGQVQVRNLWMTVDPYMRSRMNDVKSYVPSFVVGEVMSGGAVGEVVKSNDPSFSVGDKVLSYLGWREAFTTSAGDLQKIDATQVPEQAFLGALGMPGLTAWHGLLKTAGLKNGEVVFVSGAAGAVGQIVFQIAKIKGCTVIGSAGGAEKCAYLKSIGCDATIDYKAEKDLVAALAKAAPGGIDVYFDNVGGEHLDAALMAAKPFARFALCGAISQYNSASFPPGPRYLIQVVAKRLRLEGFIVSDHFDQLPEFMSDMIGWVKAGKMTWKETVDHGIENSVGAFLKLFSGENLGKMLVKL